MNCVHFYQMFKDIWLASYTHDFNGIFYVCECVAGYIHFYTGELLYLTIDYRGRIAPSIIYDLIITRQHVSS